MQLPGQRTSTKISAVVSVLAMLALAACSSSSSSSAGSSTPSSASSSTQSGQAQSTASGSFGTLGQVCGPGSATGATATGVTASSIEVATVADVGAASSPGLDQAFWDTGTAFTAWCNAAGGIDGRKLVLDKRDAALTDYPPIVQTSCTADLAMVGGQAVLDDTGLADRLKCGLPDIAPYIFGPNSVNAPLKAAAFPTPNDQVFLGGVAKFFTAFPGTKQAVGVIVPNGAAGAEQQKIFTEGLKAIGGDLVSVLEYNTTVQASWTPLVDKLRSAGVKLLLIDADLGPTAALEEAMATQNWWPQVQVVPPHLYASEFLKQLTVAPENFYVYTPIAPLEDASANPPTAQYIQIMHTYDPSGEIGFPSVEAFSSWLLFAEAAKACGSSLTRTCLMSKIATTTSWTGGGLTSQANPAANAMPACYVVLKITGSAGHLAFSRYEPASGFDCSPDNAPHIAP